MAVTRRSTCGRFVILDGLHLDRAVFEGLSRWATERGLSIQDALQLALCALRDALPASSTKLVARPRPEPEEDAGEPQPLP